MRNSERQSQNPPYIAYFHATGPISCSDSQSDRNHQSETLAFFATVLKTASALLSSLRQITFILDLLDRQDFRDIRDYLLERS